METPGRPESLNVIALISGGKDSMFSLLHCLVNGHKVVALANLHPPKQSKDANDVQQECGTQNSQWDRDVDSYMYQTAGHNLIPLYADALGLPLYRQEISGDAQDSSKSYSTSGRLHDETEALVPLLKKVLQSHPAANAISSGAILSTYQRTRIESVAVRLNLVSLSYLWQYPFLPRLPESGSKISARGLLDDMAAAGFDSRIIKVATGGLNGSLLWSDLMAIRIRQNVQKAVDRFGGSVLGEGGEYETIVVKGPASVVIFKGPVDAQVYKHRSMLGEPWRISDIWRGRIHIAETDMRRTTEDVLTFREGGGHVVPIEDTIGEKRVVPIPPIWNEVFGKVLMKLRKRHPISFTSHIRIFAAKALHRDNFISLLIDSREGIATSDQYSRASIDIKIFSSRVGSTYVISNLTTSNGGNTSISAQMLGISQRLLSLLKVHNLSTGSIIFTTILLRSMLDFPEVNRAYGELFTEPGPPARVTVACGLPAGINVMLSVVITLDGDVNALHVQSRSYWAPANIGPYSQAVSVPLKVDARPHFVFVAGQIPLVPATMKTIEPPPGTETDRGYRDLWSLDGFQPKCCLALQHLWRIGKEMEVSWWTGAVAFIVRGDDPYTRAITAWLAWREIHEPQLWEEQDMEIDDAFDVWDTAYGQRGTYAIASEATAYLPDFEKVKFEHDEQRPLFYDRTNMTYSESQDFESPRIPGFFAVEVDELPRNSDIEWQSLGIAQSEVKLTAHSVGEPGHCCLQIRSCSVSSLQRSISYIEIPFIPDLEQGAKKSSVSAGIDWVRSVAGSGKGVHMTIYTPDMSLITDIDAQIVPCHAVYGTGGRRLGAGIVANFEIRDGLNL